MKTLTIKEVNCDIGNVYEMECEDFLIRFNYLRKIDKGIYLYDHPYHYGGEDENGNEISDNLETFFAFISTETLKKYENKINETKLRIF